MENSTWHWLIFTDLKGFTQATTVLEGSHQWSDLAMNPVNCNNAYYGTMPMDTLVG